MRSNHENGQKKAPTRGSRDGNTRARRAAAHPNVHLIPRTAGQLPTWGQVLVHALVRAQFGLNPSFRGNDLGFRLARRDAGLAGPAFDVPEATPAIAKGAQTESVDPGEPKEMGEGIAVTVPEKPILAVAAKQMRIGYGNVDFNVETGNAAGISSLIRKREGFFHHCIEAGLQQDQSVSGRVSIGWEIVAGKVTGVYKVENTTGVEAIYSCFAMGIRSIHFDETLTAKISAFSWSVSTE